MQRVSLTGFLCLTLSACGGGGSDGVPALPSSFTLTAGHSATLSSGMTAMVPAGTSATTPDGSTITIGGDNSSITVPPGSVVRVPASATGPSDDTLIAAAAGASITPSGNVIHLAGSATTNSAPVDGNGAAAVFWGGGKIGVLPNGVLVVSDRGALREVTQAGVVTTIAQFGQPIDWEGVAVDATGNIFSSGSGLDPSTGVQTTVFAEVSPGSVPSVVGASLPAESILQDSGGLAVDASGKLIFVDAASNRVLRFVPGVGTTVLAGSGKKGNSDGTGAEASFSLQADTGVTVDTAGNAYLLSESSIRKITPQGVVTTVAKGLPVRAGAIALDASGAFYIGLSNTIYKVDTHGTALPYAQLGTSDFITALATDVSGNLFVGTRGFGSEIFKVTR